MAQSTALVETLKGALKMHGLTYTNVAAHLNLSEASIKRLFSTHGFTLDRIDAICAMMHMEMTDLVHMYDADRHHITHLSEEQEKELAADTKLLLVASCVRNGWSFSDIVGHYELDANECVRYLVRLDRLGMIELLPRNRIRQRIANDFRWLRNGPIERHLQREVQNDYFRSSFRRPDELRLFLSGMLRNSSREILLRKLNELAEEFSALYLEDTQHSPADKKHYGVVIALRPWELSAFRSLSKKAVAIDDVDT